MSHGADSPLATALLKFTEDCLRSGSIENPPPPALLPLKRFFGDHFDARFLPIAVNRLSTVSFPLQNRTRPKPQRSPRPRADAIHIEIAINDQMITL